MGGRGGQGGQHGGRDPPRHPRQARNQPSGDAQPHQAGRQEGRAALHPRPVPVELRRLSADLGGPGPRDAATKAKGDNDPLDVCEVGKADGKTGQIKQVKILGTWAMIDDGETDWKILVIDVNDPKAADIHDADSLEAAYPGTLKSTFEFLRDYKIPAGGGPNSFAFDNALKDAAYATQVIEETHDHWKAAFKKTDHSLSLANSTLDSNRISADE